MGPGYSDTSCRHYSVVEGLAVHEGGLCEACGVQAVKSGHHTQQLRTVQLLVVGLSTAVKGRQQRPSACLQWWGELQVDESRGDGHGGLAVLLV